MSLGQITHVVMHGFFALECGAQEWASFDDPDADGFTVYRRVPTKDGYDIEEERDFDTRPEAEDYARTFGLHIEVN